MAESWHIPRASLGSISTSSSSVANSSKSSGSRKNSNTSCHRATRRRSSLDETTNSGKSYTNRGFQPTTTRDLSYSGSFKSDLQQQRNETASNVQKPNRRVRDLGGKSRMDELRERFDESSSSHVGVSTTAAAAGRTSGIKRGSRSSQGSTDSNHSSHVSFGYFLKILTVNSNWSLVKNDRWFKTTVSSNWLWVKINRLFKLTVKEIWSLKPFWRVFLRLIIIIYFSFQFQSASSGSLLLTAANLENFARIHHKNQISPYIKEEDGNEISAYAANITMNPDISLENAIKDPLETKRVPDIDTITIDIPSDVFRSKMRLAKDFDSISMASSTHFTVVNGIGRPPKVPKSGLCDRGHQITVLIVTMSIFFMIGISLAVYFMESESWFLLLKSTGN